MSALIDGVVRDEGQLRGVAQVQRASQLPAEPAAGGFQTLQHLSLTAFVQNADIDLGVFQIRGGADCGNGDHPGDPGILDAGDQGGELPLDLLIDASNSIACHNMLLSKGGGAPGSNLNGQTGLCPLKKLLQGVRLQSGQRPSETEGSGRAVPHPQVPQLCCLAGAEMFFQIGPQLGRVLPCGPEVQLVLKGLHSQTQFLHTTAVVFVCLDGKTVLSHRAGGSAPDPAAVGAVQREGMVGTKQSDSAHFTSSRTQKQGGGTDVHPPHHTILLYNDFFPMKRGNFTAQRCKKQEAWIRSLDVPAGYIL